MVFNLEERYTLPNLLLVCMYSLVKLGRIFTFYESLSHSNTLL